jgi:hypothetical protein
MPNNLEVFKRTIFKSSLKPSDQVLRLYRPHNMEILVAEDEGNGIFFHNQHAMVFKNLSKSKDRIKTPTKNYLVITDISSVFESYENKEPMFESDSFLMIIKTEELVLFKQMFLDYKPETTWSSSIVITAKEELTISHLALMEIKKRLPVYKEMDETLFLQTIGYKKKKVVYSLLTSSSESDSNDDEQENSKIVENLRKDNIPFPEGIEGLIIVTARGSGKEVFVHSQSYSEEYFLDIDLMRSVEFIEEEKLQDKNISESWKLKVYTNYHFFEAIVDKISRGKIIFFDVNNFCDFSQFSPGVFKFPIFALKIISLIREPNQSKENFHRREKKDNSLLKGIFREDNRSISALNMADGVRMAKATHLQNNLYETVLKIDKAPIKENKDEKMCFDCKIRPVYGIFLRCESCKAKADAFKKQMRENKKHL